MFCGPSFLLLPQTRSFLRIEFMAIGVVNFLSLVVMNSSIVTTLQQSFCSTLAQNMSSLVRCSTVQFFSALLTVMDELIWFTPDLRIFFVCVRSTKALYNTICDLCALRSFHLTSRTSSSNWVISHLILHPTVPVGSCASPTCRKSVHVP